MFKSITVCLHKFWHSEVQAQRPLRRTETEAVAAGQFTGKYVAKSLQTSSNCDIMEAVFILNANQDTNGGF
jgi:hypothetical protein